MQVLTRAPARTIDCSGMADIQDVFQAMIRAIRVRSDAASLGQGMHNDLRPFQQIRMGQGLFWATTFHIAQQNRITGNLCLGRRHAPAFLMGIPITEDPSLPDAEVVLD